MIKNINDLKSYLRVEKEIYLPKGRRLELYITNDVAVKTYRYVRLLRITELFHNRKGVANNLLYVFFRRIKNTLGTKLGMDIWDNTFGKGLIIYHPGNIVVNGNSVIGRNCMLHGSNCIGNNGLTQECPVIGNNVRLGVGAKVIGNIKIADNVTIAAGAVVVDSFTEKGITIGGVPARKIK